jgi:hypothetical protein
MNDVGEEEARKPDYQRFEGEAAFQLAVEKLLVQSGRELRIFDPDGEALQLNSPARIALLDGFLRASRTRRIQLVVHHPEHLTRHCPRLLGLLKLFSHAIQINRTHEEIRNLQDAFMVLDVAHYLRRPVARYFRGAIGLNDENEAMGMRARFLEIWSASYPALSATTAGL